MGTSRSAFWVYRPQLSIEEGMERGLNWWKENRMMMEEEA